MRLRLPLFVLALASVLPSIRAELSPGEVEFFEAKIRPLLAEHCYDCHSVESGKQKGGLLLDSKWGWETGGDSGPALIPGDPGASILIDAVRRTETIVDAMPPKTALSAETVALLEEWIRQGAPDPRPKVESGTSLVEAFDLPQRFEEHWCWRPLAPPVTSSFPAGEHPVDFLIGQKLAAAGLRPAPPAEPHILLRRLHFDLTGLPPSPQESAALQPGGEAFDVSGTIDRLLDSPQFGEKWARHWLDLLRYADTYGHEFDYPIPHAHEYRDYLIRAFNADLPYDQFIREHVAGDLLPAPRRHPEEGIDESVIATGFWFLHEATHAPTDVLANEAGIMDNQIDVLSKTFLSLTVSCARCHDHKFDAISTADYHALTAYLQSSARQEAPLDPGASIASLTETLAGLRDSASAALPASPASVPSRLSPGAHFAAAARLFQAERSQPAPAGDPWDGDLFEDFEGDYSGWEVTGDAFGDAPARGTFPRQQAVSGFRGQGLINSFNGNDRKTGTLTSKPFTIRRPWLNFLIGGGAGPTTALELLIDGKPVRTAHGENRETLEPASLDLSEFLGREAVLRIVDHHKGGWGHLNLDHLVFADVPVAQENHLPSVSPARVAQAARAANLDPDRLQAWARLLSSANLLEEAPAAFLARSLHDPGSLGPVRARLTTSNAAWQAFHREARLWESFDGSELPPGWSTSGPAFAPTGPAASLRLHRDDPFAQPGVIDSALLGERQEGTLRSPTFEITSDFIHVRLQSEDITARVVVDNYQMQLYHPLLFAGTIVKGADTDTGGAFHWISFDRDLAKYRGHRAYLEFVDQGDGFAAIDAIWFSDRPVPSATVDPLVQSWLASGDAPSTDSLATALDTSLARSLSVLAGRAEPVPGDLEFLRWLNRNGLVTLADLHPGPASTLAEARQLAASLPQPRYALAIAEGTPEPASIAVRGNPHNPGDLVPPRFLEALGAVEGDRLTLANQIASPENPLTARSVVNRLWHHLFGRGLVPTVDDFGPMGQPPSHPELLDWLAADFIAHGWSVKHTLKTIVSSRTYQQSSLPHPSLDPSLLATADPSNLLLHRAPVRRLPAEAVRDSILAVSGQLDHTPFGPGVPTHRTDFMTGRGARPSGPLDGDARRTIYLAVYRNFLNPLLLTFDMPSPFGPKGRRSVSNVPAQALALLNDPFVREQAAHWAERTLQSHATPEECIEAMMQDAFARAPTTSEREILLRFVATHPDPGLPAWSDLAHLLLNRKEFIYLR